MHLFAVLADPVRRLLVETLAGGEHTVAELTDMAMFDFRISRTAVSHHLRILRDEHLLLARQPYLTDPILPARRHRPDRSGLRGRGRADDIWRRPSDHLGDPERTWLSDPIDDEGDVEHRWVAEGGDTALRSFRPVRLNSLFGVGVGVGVRPS